MDMNTIQESFSKHSVLKARHSILSHSLFLSVLISHLLHLLSNATYILLSFNVTHVLISFFGALFRVVLSDEDLHQVKVRHGHLLSSAELCSTLETFGLTGFCLVLSGGGGSSEHLRIAAVSAG